MRQKSTVIASSRRGSEWVCWVWAIRGSFRRGFGWPPLYSQSTQHTSRGVAPPLLGAGGVVVETPLDARRNAKRTPAAVPLDALASGHERLPSPRRRCRGGIVDDTQHGVE